MFKYFNFLLLPCKGTALAASIKGLRPQARFFTLKLLCIQLITAPAREPFYDNAFLLLIQECCKFAVHLNKKICHQ